jgi:hypothetical protein
MWVKDAIRTYLQLRDGRQEVAGGLERAVSRGMSGS